MLLIGIGEQDEYSSTTDSTYNILSSCILICACAATDDAQRLFNMTGRLVNVHATVIIMHVSVTSHLGIIKQSVKGLTIYG